MRKNNKLLIALSILLVFQSVFVNVDFSYANSSTKYFVNSGYFEYWRDPTTKVWKYDDDKGRHDFEGPGKFIYSYDTSFSVPSGYRLKSIKVFESESQVPSGATKLVSTSYEDLRRYHVEDMSIKDADKLVGATGRADYTISFKVPDQSKAESFPVDNIRVYRHYVARVMEVEPITNPDKVVVKYQDMTGNTLKPDDAAKALGKKGYNDVYPDDSKHSSLLTEGYTLNSPKSGYTVVYNSELGSTHEVIFKYEPPLGAFATVTGTANPNPVKLSSGKGTTQLTVEGQVHNLPKGVTVKSTKLLLQSSGSWLNKDFVSSSTTQQHNFGSFEITGTTIFPVKVEAVLSNNETLTADGQIIVYTEEEIAPPEEAGKVNAVLWLDVKPGEGYSTGNEMATIEMSKADFDADKETIVRIELDAQDSTSDPYDIDKYRYTMRNLKSRDYKPFYYGDLVSEDKIEIELPFKPSDINAPNNRVEMQGRLTVVDTKKNQATTNKIQEIVEFIINIMPPETKLYLPEYFYPKQITDLGYTNIIGWDYYSEDKIPYKKSIVSLYKLVNDEPEIIFEDKVMIDRELEVEGLPDEEFRIIVKVVDIEGNMSEPVTEDFVIMNASPIIEVTLNTEKEDENLLGVNVENLTPTVIESLFPTQYTSYKIVDMNGNTLESGIGEVPEWINLDERYHANIATVIQYAENNLGNTAQDHASYINNSKLDFIVEPNKLFEQELAEVIDLTRAIDNKNWQIQNIFEEDREELIFIENEDEENKDLLFTQDEGKYLVWLFGNGRIAYQRNLYQYTNNKADLRSQLPNVPLSSFIDKTYGKGNKYAHHTAKWNGPIQKGDFDEEGTKYKYRRSLSYYTTAIEESYKAQDVEFISGVPIADLKITGTLKMYKKVTLDGTGSIEKTIAKNTELQEKYPIQFNHERTLFMIEPITDNKFDSSKNQYILGHGKEIVNGKVVFKAKDIQHVRFDKEGLYKVSYKVYNGLKESEFVEQLIEIREEKSPTVDIKVLSPIVYRNPKNELKSEIRLEVIYKLADEDPKDMIDFEKSKLLVSFDNNHDNNFTNDGEHSEQWIMKDEEYLLDYIKVINKDFREEKATFTLEVDNETKNMLGNFKFEFVAYEKPSVPNYNELGKVEDIKVDTFDIDEVKKKILIDNQKPVIHLSSKKDNEVEVYFIDTTGNINEAEEQIQSILSQLKINKIKATIYLIKEDNTIATYNN